MPRSFLDVPATRVSSLLLALFAGLILPGAAVAQTAHFSGAIAALGSGLDNPHGVAVDGSGNVFVADTGNNAVKEILAAGGYATVDTLASGFSRPSGLAVDRSGNVFVADTGNNAVKEILAAGGYTTVNTLGHGFSRPTGVAVGGSGNVFVADTGNNAVKEILAAGGYTTVNKLGAGFSGPQGVALDGSGNVFVADTGNNAMKEILAANGYTEVVPLVGTGLSGPSGLVLDGSGNIFVADTGNNAVKEILAAGGYTTVNTLSSGFSGPQGVALDGSGDLFVADGRGAWEFWTTSVNLGTVSIGTTSAVATLTFTFDTGGTVAAPMVLTQGAAGLDFADAGTGTCTTNGTSYTYSAGDTCTVSVKFAPTHPGQRDGAVELLDNSGNLLATGYVWGIGTGPQAIFANTTSGDYLPSVQSLLGSGFNNPDSVAVDGSGNVFVADSGNAAVYEITQASGYTTVNTLGSGFGQPWGVAVDGAGNVFVADATNGAVYEITQASGYTTVNTLGSGFYSPTGVAVDGSGNVFVADIANVAVYEITQASGYNTVNTLGGGFSEPEGVAVDGSGNVFVTDFYAAAVKEIPPGCTSSSCVQTLGGVVTNPYGVAVDATGNVFVTYVNFNAVAEITRASGYTAGISLGSGFQEPTGVVVDGSGNVYVANNRGQVMRLDFSDTPSLSFANTLAGSTSSDSPQTVTVTNDGNAALTFTTLSYPADFPEGDGDTNACTTSNSLNAGLACDLPVNFIPQTTSSLSESLTLTDNTLNASPSVTQSISLSGTGTVPSPASQLVFGVAPAAIVTPGGNAGSAVTVLEEDAGGNVSAEAADTITLTVTYPDTTTQTYTAAAVSGVATFNLSGAALTQPGSYTYTASFTGLTSAMALEIVAPPASTAPATSVGTPSATQTATMYLNSSFTLGSIAVLTQGAPSSNNTDFQTAAGGTCAVGTAYTAGETCTVNYTFNPQHPGPRYGAVVLYDNASPANTVVTVYLQGTGEGAQAVFSSNNIQSVLGSGYGNPAGVAVDASGNVFVADVATSAVTEILAAGGYTTVNTLGSGFANPSSVAVDGAGNVFVADANNSAVKEILAAGGYTTVNTLGSGFNTPQSVAVDGAGNVFVADTWNNAVKEILAAGGYTTVLTLGSGFGGPDSVAVDGAGNVFVGDTANNAVKEILAAGGYTTVKTLGSGFDNPWGVAVDASGNVFVADAVNSAVKEILAAGGYTTVLTLGSGFYVPFGVALDGAGNVIVADSLNAAVKKLDFSDGPSLSFAPTPGGTIGTDSPQTVTVANDGNQPLTFSAVSYAADFPEAPGVATDCTTTTPVASGASCTLSIDFLPSAPSDTGDVPLTESIEITDNTAASQSVMTVNGTETAPPPAQLVFGVAPAAVIGVGGNAGSAVTVEEEDAVGSLLPELTNTITLTVTGPNSYSQTYTATAVGGVATFNLSGTALTQPGNYTWTASYATLTSAVASETVVSAAITAPATTVGTPSGTQTAIVYLSSNFTLGSIAVLTQGAPNLDFQAAAGGTCAIGTAYTAVETCTVNYTFDPKHPGPRYGAVVLYDNASPANAVATVYLQGTGEGPQAIFSSNNIQIALGSGLSSPAGVAADASGNVFVADADNNAVKEILAAGGYTTVNTLAGGFSRPAGVAVDGVGNVFVADTDNNAVKEIPPGCILSSCVKTLGSGFSDPYGVAVDGAGNVFVADSANNAVKEILAAGGYTTVNTLNSSFSLPFGVAVDGSGNVFVADTFNSAVKEILAAGGYTTVKTLGSGFSNPFGVAVDGNGNVFVADTFNSAVKEILAAGGYTAVKTLGSGFTNPYGVAVDGSGNVYVADLVSTAVNKLDYSDPPSLSFATTAAGSTSSGSPKTVTVANDGNQTLTFSAVSYGTDFPEAPGVATDCTTSTNLASGASCTLSVDFSPLGPSATGTSTSLSEGLGLTDNANGSPQSITLSGTETVPPPFGVMTAPEDATTKSTTVTQGDGVLVTGWAADVHDGAPVHQVSILIDGTAVGNATLGIARPGIATEYGSAYLNSGWTYTYSGSLAAGTHTMTVVLYDSLGLSTQLPTHTFTVSSASAPPYGALTQAVDAITKTTPIGQNDGLLVTGWAADLVQGAPVSQVKVFIDGTSVGNAMLSVAGPSGEPANSGWTFTDATPTTGTHTVSVVAYDSGGRSATLGSRTITVQANAPPFGVMTSPEDAVTGSTTVTQGDHVLVTGWAADVHDGAPITRVSISIDGTAVGNATLGIARPGIAADYGSAYLHSGWTYTYSGSLAAGTHTMTAVLYDSLGLSTQLPTHTFTVSSASAPPYGALTQAVDAITKTTPIGQNDGLLVTGWAADLVQGAPVSQVKVFIDGTSVGNATLSVAGPSGEPANSGWTFTDATPTTGTHTVSVVAYDSGGRSATLGSRTITVQANAPPFGVMTAPEDATTKSTTVTQGDGVLVTGWAADVHDGAPVHQVSILIDGTAVGNATLGIARPGIATEYGSAYLNSGWTYTYSGSLAAGTHTMTVVLYDSLGLSTQLPTHTFTVSE